MPIDIPGWVERQPNLGNMYLEQAIRMRQMASQAPIDRMNALKVQEAQRQQAAEADYRMRLSGLDYSDPNKLNVAPMINAALQSGNTGQIGPLSQLASALKPAGLNNDFLETMAARKQIFQKLETMPKENPSRSLYEKELKLTDQRLEKLTLEDKQLGPIVQIPGARKGVMGQRNLRTGEWEVKDKPESAGVAGRHEINTELKLYDDYKEASRPFLQVKPAYETATEYLYKISSGKTKPTPASDGSLSRIYLKMYDPTINVRDREAINKFAAIPTRFTQYIVNNLFEGTLFPDEVRKEIYADISMAFDSVNAQQQKIEDDTMETTKRYNLDPRNVVRTPYAIRRQGGSQPGQPGGPAPPGVVDFKDLSKGKPR